MYAVKRHVALPMDWSIPLVVLSMLTAGSLALHGAFDAPLYGPDGLVDEQAYHSGARHVWQGTLPASDWCPGFVLFYAVFAHPWASDDFSYHAVRIAVSLAVVILTYAAVRRIAMPSIAFAAGLALALNFNLSIILTLRIAIAAVVALALVLADHTPRRAALTLALLYLGILIRPEFLPMALLASLLLARSIAKSAKWFAAPAAAVLVVGIYLCMVRPGYRERGGRMSIAFGQHYAWTANELGSWNGDRWREYEVLLKQDFDGAKTMPEFIRYNPAAVARHIAHNFSVLPMNLVQTLALGPSRAACFILPALLFTIIGFGIVRLWRRRTLLIILHRNADQLRIGAAATGMYLFWLLIRPRTDYQFALVPVWMVLCGLMVKALLPGSGEALVAGRDEQAPRIAGDKETTEDHVRNLRTDLKTTE